MLGRHDYSALFVALNELAQMKRDMRKTTGWAE
jgi:hypothetical protein